MDIVELKKNPNKNLSLVYTENNYYAIVTDSISNKILWFEKSKTFEDLEIKKVLFDYVNVYSVTQKFTLLPTALLEENQAREYLEYTTNLTTNDIVLTDKEALSKIAIIWALKSSVKENIIKNHKQALFYNLMSLLIGKSNGYRDENKIVTFFLDDLLIVLVSKNKIFQFVNLFEIESIEDALYYHLLTLQSLELEESNVHVYTGGFYNDMETFLVKMKSYFSQVERLTIGEAIKKNQAYLDLAAIIN